MKGFERFHSDREQLDPVVKRHAPLPVPLSKTGVLKNTHEQSVGITAAKAACLVMTTPSPVKLSNVTHFSLLIFQPTGKPSQQAILGIEHPFAHLLFGRKEPQKKCDRPPGKEEASTNI